MVPSIPGASSDYGISKVCTVALVGSMDAFFLPNKARMAGSRPWEIDFVLLACRIIWLVASNMNFIFHNIWDNPSP